MMYHDSPLLDPKDDALDRQDFAKSVAQSIAGFQPNDSVVLALVGPWGSGKSTLINFITDHLAKLAGPPIVIRYNPWRYSGSDQLFAGFFATLAAAIGVEDKIPALKGVKETLQRTARTLSFGKYIPQVGHFFSEMGSAVDSATKTLGSLQEVLQSVDVLHEALSTQLAEAKTRLLVIIDDIDRLSPEEVLQVFQLVKALADFPYVMYLLAYDESVVMKAIDRDPIVARAYLEKIVSIPLDVPPPHRGTLDELGYQAIAGLLEPSLPKYFDEERLLSTYVNCYRQYFRTMRHIRRFANMFAFNFGRLQNKVDVGDLAAITALQVFEHGLFQQVAKSPDRFIDTDVTVWQQDRKNPSKVKEQIEELVDSAGCADRKDAIALLRSIFPKADYAYKGQEYGLTSKVQNVERRASSQSHFYKFFNMNTTPGELSDEEYVKARQLFSTSTERFILFLTELGIDKAKDFLSKSNDDHSLRLLPDADRVRALVSLYMFENRFAKRSPVAPLSMPISWKVGNLANHVLSEIDGEKWTSIYIESINALQAGIGSASAILDRARLHGGKPEINIPSLTDVQLQRMIAATSLKVHSLLQDGMLLHEEFLGFLIATLHEWGEDKIASTVEAAIRASSTLLIAYCASMVMRGGFEGVLQRKKRHFNFVEIGKLQSIDEIRQRFQSLSRADLDENNVSVIEDFLEATAAAS